MANREYDVATRLLQPDEIKQARLTLDLSRKAMAELMLLSPAPLPCPGLRCPALPCPCP